jgi:hypothetical protein
MGSFSLVRFRANPHDTTARRRFQGSRADPLAKPSTHLTNVRPPLTPCIRRFTTPAALSSQTARRRPPAARPLALSIRSTCQYAPISANTEVAAMYTSLLQHTPYWVWGALAALTLAGIRQSVPRRRSIRSATSLPLVMTAFSFYGVASDFAHQPLALAGWALGAAVTFAVSIARSAWQGVRWSAADGNLVVPGSWLPLALYLGLFCVKFAVGFTLAANPARVDEAGFACMTGLAFGTFSGIFLARGFAMWRVAREVLTRNAAPF